MSRPLPETFKISQTDFDLIQTPEVTVKEIYDKILIKINIRVGYIFNYINKVMKRNPQWQDYDNKIPEGPGFFDPIRYREQIILVGEPDLKTDFCYSDRFPTSWLNNDFEKELKIKYAEFLESKRDKKIALAFKKKKQIIREKRMKAAIRAKLSHAEFKLIRFKDKNEG